MKFEIVNTLDKVKELYTLPKTKERFDKYLFLLQGQRQNELILPIAGFNPMGNQRATEKLDQLISLNAEGIAQEELVKINETFQIKDDSTIQVGINLVDDVGGAWSNYYTMDYASKFEFESLLKRSFCTPYFWTSEIFSEHIIQVRIREYVYRTLFWILNGKPETVYELMQQEIFINKNSNLHGDDKTNVHPSIDKAYKSFENIYKAYKDSKEYGLKFNLFYGDTASRQLAYLCYGVNEVTGFDYARFLSMSHDL